jgi:hypothetical protein
MLRLLADQLDRPTPKHLTPALGFGFAVDGWNRAFESFFTLLRSIAKKCDSGQSRASIEGTTPYIGYTIRDRDARQAGAFLAEISPDDMFYFNFSTELAMRNSRNNSFCRG